MELGSEVYSMSLTLQLQKIVSSPLTQELRLSPAATVGASSDTLFSATRISNNNWLGGESGGFSDTHSNHNLNYNEWNSSSDVITATRIFPVACPTDATTSSINCHLSLQPFADFDITSSSNASTDSFYSHANSSLAYSPLSASSSSYAPSGGGVAAAANAMQDLELYYRHSTTMNIVYIIVYSIVFIVGLIGNSFVIAVVLRAPRMRTVTNYFIVNLAIADILVIVFCLPATLMSNIFVRK